MSSYTQTTYLPQHQPTPPSYYTSATPPAPPPKPSSTEVRNGPPPPPLPGQTEVSELDGNQSYPNNQQAYQQNPHAQQQQQQQINIPAIEPGWLPEGIRDKTTTDLHHLLTNTELLNSLLSNPSTTHPSIPASQQTLLQLLDSNISLSNHLLTLEGQLKQHRSSTQQRLLALKALEQQHRQKIEETERALQQFSPMALYQRLSASVGEQENLVRGVEESWMEDIGDGEGGMASSAEVESFVKRVKEAGKVSFLRRERKGRWDEGRVGGWR